MNGKPNNMKVFGIMETKGYKLKPKCVTVMQIERHVYIAY
jgi:hypothetical protein